MLYSNIHLIYRLSTTRYHALKTSCARREARHCGQTSWVRNGATNMKGKREGKKNIRVRRQHTTILGKKEKLIRGSRLVFEASVVLYQFVPHFPIISLISRTFVPVLYTTYWHDNHNHLCSLIDSSRRSVGRLRSK